MSGIQLYLKGNQACVRNGTILQKLQAGHCRLCQHPRKLPVLKNKENGLLSNCFGNQGGFIVFGLFFGLLVSFFNDS